MKIFSFTKKYQGRILEDAGAYKSQEFIQFAKDMKSTIREICKENDAELVQWSVGHYDVNGFILRNGKYVYFSYSEPRYMEIDLNRSDPMLGILIRTTKHEKDYTGGPNNFCNIHTFSTFLCELTRPTVEEGRYEH